MVFKLFILLPVSGQLSLTRSAETVSLAVIGDLGSTGSRVHISDCNLSDYKCSITKVGGVEGGIHLAHNSSTSFDDYLKKLSAIFKKAKTHSLFKRFKASNLGTVNYLIYGTAGLRQYEYSEDVYSSVRKSVLEVFDNAIEDVLITENLAPKLEAEFVYLAVNTLIKQEIKSDEDSDLRRDGKPYATFEYGGQSFQFSISDSSHSTHFKSYPYGSEVGYKQLGGVSSACNFAPDGTECEALDGEALYPLWRCKSEGDGGASLDVDFSEKCQNEIKVKFSELGEKIKADFAFMTENDWDAVHLMGLSTAHWIGRYLDEYVFPYNRSFTTLQDLRQQVKVFNNNQANFNKKYPKAEKYHKADTFLDMWPFKVNSLIKYLEWLGIPETKKIHHRSKINDTPAKWALGAHIKKLRSGSFLSKARDFIVGHKGLVIIGTVASLATIGALIIFIIKYYSLGRDPFKKDLETECGRIVRQSSVFLAANEQKKCEEAGCVWTVGSKSCSWK